MENRFAFKDLVVCILLGAQIVVVIMAMVMFDRQWKDVQTIVKRVDEHTEDLAQIRRTLAEGVIAQPGPNNGGTTITGGSGKDAPSFDRVNEARKDPDYAVGDWFIDAFGTNLPKLTPLVSSDIYASIVQCRVLEWLAVQDPNTLEYKPHLATSWEVDDNSEAWRKYVDQRKAVPLTEAEIRKEAMFPEDDKGAAEQQAYINRRMKEGRLTADIAKEKDCPYAIKVTFQLRKGVTFSDGAPFTAHDVKFTYDFLMDKNVAAPRPRAYYEKVKAVEAPDDYTVIYYFNEPYFEYMSLASGMDILPKHYYQKYQNATGEFTYEKFNQSTCLLIGSGPYRLATPTAWKPGETIELIRNERYWGQPGPFDRILFRIIEDESVEMTMFKNGEFDFFGALPEQYEALMKDEKVLARTQRFEFYNPRGGYMYIAWNQMRNGKPTVFADKRVRQAMTYMTDRQRLVDDIFLGYGRPASGPFFEDLQQSDPNIKPRPFDMAKAKALLKEAGFEDRDKDGVVESPSGEPLSFKLSYPSKSPTFERVVLYLRDAYGQAGVLLIPEPTDWPVMIQKLDNRDFDAISLRWSAGFETDIYQMFHSNQIQDNGDNFMSYNSPELDRVIEQARTTLDPAKRMPLWQEAHRILYEDQPYTFLMRNKSLAFLDNRIKNVQRTKAGLNYVSTWVYPLEWYVPKGARKWAK